MLSEQRQIVSILRDAEHLTPSFEFVCPARIDIGRLLLLSEGSPTLEARLTLTQVRGEASVVKEYVCPMPTSYQNFLVIDIPDVEVLAGDRFDFSVNDPEASCVFVIEAFADSYLIPAPVEVVPEPQEEVAEA